MYRVNIYNYVLDSLNNILDNGLDYYKDKDKELYNKLECISNYIKENSIVSKCDDVEEPKKVLNANIPDSVHDILENFMNKMAQIKIDVLNIESSRTLYYEEYTNIKSEEPLIEQVEEDIHTSIDEVDTVNETDITSELSTNEKEEQNDPPKKSILDIFKW